MQLWKGVARQIGSQGALKKLPAATSQFHGAIALPLDHSSYAMGTSWSFGVWCLWSPCSMVQDTLCSLAVVASGEMQHRHENMLQELLEPILAEEHFKHYQINIKSILFNRASKVFSPFQSWCTMNELLVLTKVPFRPVWNKCTMRYLEYPEEMHDLHKDYPMAPEIMSISEDMLSTVQKDIHRYYYDNEAGDEKTNKSVLNVMDKKRYVLNISALTFYLQHGLKLKKRFTEQSSLIRQTFKTLHWI